MTDLAQFVQLQHRVMAFLAEQPADRLVALAEGRVSLSLSDGGQRPVDPPVATTLTADATTSAPRVTKRSPTTRVPVRPDVDGEAIAKSLRGKETMDEAADELARHKLTVGGLNLVAQALGIVPKGVKADRTRQILNQAVGARLKFDSLRQG